MKPVRRRRYWHLCPVHGVEECTWVLEKKYRTRPGDDGMRSHCWNEGYGPAFGPHVGMSHFCWVPNGYSPGWFTGLLYYTRQQARKALDAYPLPVQTCHSCGHQIEDSRGNTFDGADAYHNGTPIRAR